MAVTSWKNIKLYYIYVLSYKTNWCETCLKWTLNKPESCIIWKLNIKSQCEFHNNNIQNFSQIQTVEQRHRKTWNVWHKGGEGGLFVRLLLSLTPKISYIGTLYLIFRLYRILVYLGFILDRFHISLFCNCSTVWICEKFWILLLWNSVWWWK
jgi:hypothetical protein